MLRIENFFDYSTVSLSNIFFHADDETKKIVDDVWENRSSDEKTYLFNGNIFSAINISCHEIQAIIIEYKYYFAKLKLPHNLLLKKLVIFPIAVSGLIECKDGYIFGKRSLSLTEERENWELVPSGGLNTDILTPDKNINFKQQLLIELTEEIGIESDLVTEVKPFCCVIDENKKIIDIGIYLYINQTKEFIYEKYSQLKKKEYDALNVVKKEEVALFLREHSNNFVNISRALLEKHLQTLFM